MYYFIIPGEPKAKGRPRVARCGPGGFVKMYSPKKTVEYENLIRLFFAKEHPLAKPLEGAIRMEISAYFSIPKSKSKRVKADMLRGVLEPTKRPDWDNIGKLFADALCGIAFRDDAQICEAIVMKHYSDTPCCTCLIEQIERRIP